uniref:HD_domain domain-containing protein n=1 Tax=Angiostrongylus cantonensis TaxID=6313 RepID=A0A0K0D2Q2_ANGCA
MSLEGQFEELDVGRTVTMCLVHDLAVAIVDDITPYYSVSTKEKHDLENKAIHKIATYVPVAAVGEQWIEQWEEYETQETLEAKAVKHLDKLDMVAQAFEYERKAMIAAVDQPILRAFGHVVKRLQKTNKVGLSSF